MPNTPDFPSLAVPPLAADTFGDRFDIAQLPLARPACGYAVQRLDSDHLLDQQSLSFFPIRQPGLNACFSDFDAAFAAAATWLARHQQSVDHHDLAIVPLGYDPLLQRPILIYGVIRSEP